MRSIGRKIVTSKCSGQRFNKKLEELEDFYEEIYGMVTVQSATKYFQKSCGDSSIIITNVDFEEHYYKMSLDDFISNSERVY